MFWKRRIIPIGLCVCMLLLFSGCKQRQTALTLAVLFTDTRLEKAVENFNAENPDLAVSLQVYDSAVSLRRALEDGGTAGPDMFFLPESVASGTDLRGYCTDLASLLAADPELSPESFVPGLYSGLLRSGQAPWLPYDFTLMTFGVQPPAEAGAEPFTVAQARQMAELRGELLFPAYWDRSNLMQWLSPYLAAAYVDRETRACAFDGPELAALLEAVGTHPVSLADMPVEQDNLLQYVSLNGTLSMLANYEYALDAEGTAYAFPGVPGEAANGSLFYVNNCFGIFSPCAEPALAWRFLKLFLTEAGQEAAGELPAVQQALEQRLGALVSQGRISEPGKEKVLSLIEATTCVADTGSILPGLIETEARAVFDGVKTAREAAAEIQARAEEIVRHEA